MKIKRICRYFPKNVGSGIIGIKPKVVHKAVIISQIRFHQLL